MKKFGMNRKYVWALSILCLVIGLTVVSYIVYGSIDAEEPDVSDLVLELREPIPDEENALVELKLGIAAMEGKEKWNDFYWTQVKTYYDEDKLIEKSDWQTILEENSEALDLLEKSLKKGDLYSDHNFQYDDKCEYIDAIHLHRLLNLRAVDRLSKGDFERGVADLQLSKKLPSLIYKNEDLLVGALIAVAIEDGRMRSVEYLLTHYSFSKSEYKQLLDVLGLDTEALHEMMTTVMKGEFTMMRNVVNSLSAENAESITGEKAGVLYKFYFHKNRTMTTLAELMRNSVEASRMRPKQCLSHLDSCKATDGFKKYVKKNKWVRKISPNLIGDSLLVISSPIIGKQNAKAYQTDTVRDLLKLKIASKIYQLENGRTATSIDDLHLVLGEKLYDPFTEKEGVFYHYDPAKKAVWSVGMDGLSQHLQLDAGELPNDFFNFEGQEGRDYIIYLDPKDSSLFRADHVSK